MSRPEDESYMQKIEAKNRLGNFCFTGRSTLQEEKLKVKFMGGGKYEIEKAVQETLPLSRPEDESYKQEIEVYREDRELRAGPHRALDSLVTVSGFDILRYVPAMPP